MNKKANRLIHEKSPYLLQHAYNPVDWYPWGEEAFEKAKKEDKPIFLSIGYSTCHWCHVMEHESFEDSSVAELMNEVFVSIKVDREERPDIDHIYMNVCQIMTGRGGWPLSVVLTPDKKPFFAGTYFPKESRYGRMGFQDLIGQINEVWKTKRNEIESTSKQITDHLNNVPASAQGEKLTESILRKAFDDFNTRFDKIHGGFGQAPKFPSPQNFLFLLRYWNRTGDADALEMVEKTLTEMQKGGVYDHIGYGFHRYSTDREWLVPHFEKMLYDQAMLSMALTETYQATKNIGFKKIAEQIFEYVLRDMTSKEGGFYSAEDADSDGEEGKFYVWKISELEQILTIEEKELFIKIYNISEEGNFVNEATGKRTGENISHLKKSVTDWSWELKMDEEVLSEKIEKIRLKLFEEREKRIHPYKDDKILTDWNGMMIASLAAAGRTFGNKKYVETAENCTEFILDNLKKDGRLLHRYRDGEAGITANLDDYSFFIWGLIELYQSTFNSSYLKEAIDLLEYQIKNFWDEENSGFFFTADSSEQLIVRTKEFYDGAIPSGNASALSNLIRLNRITGNTAYEDIASKLVLSISTNMEKFPAAYIHMFSGLVFSFGPSSEIVVAGDLSSTKTQELLAAINDEYLPNKIVVVLPENKSDEIYKLAPYAKDYTLINNKPSAYVCQNFTCNLPTSDPEEMLKLLKSIYTDEKSK